MASLCISPVQAGIMLLRTANSSFILDRLRRSIKLWAVLRAILRPAALVADGCFFLVAVDVVAAAAVEVDEEEEEDEAAAAAVLADDEDVALEVAGPACSDAPSSWARGFIWMILRDLVGGGGRANESLAAVDDLLRDLTVSAACSG